MTRPFLPCTVSGFFFFAGDFRVPRIPDGARVDRDRSKQFEARASMHAFRAQVCVRLCYESATRVSGDGVFRQAWLEVGVSQHEDESREISFVSAKMAKKRRERG